MKLTNSFALLLAQGCDEIQGYYFCRPLPADELAKLLREGRTLRYYLQPAGQPGRKLTAQTPSPSGHAARAGRLEGDDREHVRTARDTGEVGPEEVAIDPVEPTLPVVDPREDRLLVGVAGRSTNLWTLSAVRSTERTSRSTPPAAGRTARPD